jgi:crotonobetainyl-CoA:carnitine CoA-transferase CaiB-like acyl-CoA transferase
LGERTTEEWLRVFAGKVPAAPVNDIAQALTSAFVAEHANIETYTDEGGRAARMIAQPVRVVDEALPKRAAPGLGEHTEALLKALGYDSARIAQLRASKVI